MPTVNMEDKNAEKYLLKSQLDGIKNELKTGLETFLSELYKETQKFKNFPYKTGHLKNESWFQNITAMGDEHINIQFGYSTKDSEHPEYAMIQDYRKGYFSGPFNKTKGRLGRKGILPKELLKAMKAPRAIGRGGGGREGQ